jgi:hypothetical protein
MRKAMEFTVTQRLRLFLARSGQTVAPWSSVEEVMDRLYSLLFQRREQAGLWENLAALLDSIQADARGVLAAPDAEILSQSRVNELVTELRQAMRASSEAPTAGAMRRFSMGKSASVLACIALLAAGFSLGCTSSTSRADGGADATTTPADVSRPADTASNPAPDSAPALVPDVALVATPDTAPSVSPDTGLTAAGGAPGSPADAMTDGSSDSSSRDALMDLFRDGTPEDIAARLEASVADSPADRQVDKPMVLYKGVTFPTEKTV